MIIAQKQKTKTPTYFLDGHSKYGNVHGPDAIPENLL
jgi:hypothetical protein